MLEVADLRRRLDNPLTVCTALGLAKGAKRQPRGVTVLCPLHKEKSPSCSVTIGDDGTLRFNCFGCSATGDVLTLIAAVRGLDVKTQFPEVLEQAAELAGLEATSCSRSCQLATTDAAAGEPRRISPASYNAIAQRLVELCPVDPDSDVFGYVERRILLLQASLARCAALPRPELQVTLIERLREQFGWDSLIQAGLVWQAWDKQLAHPENRLVIPWRGLDGSITTLQRRRLDDWKPKYVFPPGTRPPLPFGAEQLRAHDADRVIVFVEGALDVLALRLLDRRDGLGILPLGIPGLGGWRSEWARFAKGRTVRIGFDADDAAEKSVQSVADDLAAAGAVAVERWTPNAKDWCALVEQQVGVRKELAR